MSSNFVYALKVQRRALSALMFREWGLTFGKRTFGISSLVASLSIKIALFALVRVTFAGALHRGMEIVPFIATGVVAFWTMRRATMIVAGGTRVKSTLSRFPQVTPLDIAIVRGLIMTGAMTAISFVIFIVLIGTGYSQSIYRPDLVVFYFFLCGMLGIGVGIIFGCVYRYLPFLRRFLMMSFMVMMFISGIFYVIPEIPYKVREYFLYNPLLHLTDLTRGAYFAVYHSELSDLSYVIRCIIIIWAIALIAERASRSRQENG